MGRVKYCTFITWVQKRRRRGTPGQAEDNPVAAGTKAEVRWVGAVMEKPTAKTSSANLTAPVMIVQGPGAVGLEPSEDTFDPFSPGEFFRNGK